MQSYHDTKTRDSIQDFQVASQSAQRAFDEQAARVRRMNSDLADVQRAVAALDDTLRYNNQTISVLEEQEARLKASRSGHDAELDKQAATLAALRKPREDAEAERGRIAADVDETQGALLRTVTALASGIVQAAADASLVPQLRASLQRRRAEMERWQAAVAELAATADKEEAAMQALKQQIETLQKQKQDKINEILQNRDGAGRNSKRDEDDNDASSFKENKNNNTKNSQLGADGAARGSGDNNNDKTGAAATPQLNSKERLARLQQQLKDLKKKHSDEQAALIAERDALNRQHYALVQESEATDAQLQKEQAAQEQLLDELENTTCTRCGQRNLSAESGHDE